MTTIDEHYSDNLDALEASMLGEKSSVLSQLTNDDHDSPGSGGLRRRSARDEIHHQQRNRSNNNSNNSNTNDNNGDGGGGAGRSGGHDDSRDADSGDELLDPAERRHRRGNSRGEVRRPSSGREREREREWERRRGTKTRVPSAKTKKYQDTHNTGIKGILADYHKAQERAAAGKVCVRKTVLSAMWTANCGCFFFRARARARACVCVCFVRALCVLCACFVLAMLRCVRCLSIRCFLTHDGERGFRSPMLSSIVLC